MTRIIDLVKPPESRLEDVIAQDDMDETTASVTCCVYAPGQWGGVAFALGRR